MIGRIAAVVRTEYFSDTNTSTYAVPDTYSAAGELALVDPGRAHGLGLGHGLSTSFKPYSVLSPTAAAAAAAAASSPFVASAAAHPRDLYAGGETAAGGLGLQGCSGNSCYAVVPEMGAVELARWTTDIDPPPVLEFHPDSLRFVEKLGEGPHGEVSSGNPFTHAHIYLFLFI